MDNKFNWSSAKKVTLSPSEKGELKNTLMKGIAMHSSKQLQSSVALSTQERIDIKQGIMQHIYANSFTVDAQSHWLLQLVHACRHHIGYAVFTVIFICTSTMGAVAYSAESAVPGDVLYSVKININEPFIGRFKRSNTQKAEWQAEKLNRRIRETRSVMGKPDKVMHFLPSLERLEQHAIHMEQTLETIDSEIEKERMREHLDANLELHATLIDNTIPAETKEEQVRQFKDMLNKGKKRFKPLGAPRPGDRRINVPVFEQSSQNMRQQRNQFDERVAPPINSEVRIQR